MRLDKFLAKCGQGTRSEAKKLIWSGQVTVDGEVIKDPTFNIDAQATQVAVQGHRLRYQEHYYLMLNKPPGVISATRDRLHPTVLGLLPLEYQHLDLFPVGRLDKDTEGLMLLSDDGVLAHRLLAPKRQVPKTYRARVRGEVNEQDIERFTQGIELKDFTTLPAQLRVLAAGEESHIEVTIYEGKFHQVKRMFHAVGKEVLYLQRVAFGGLVLDPSLPLGRVRELTAAELDLLGEWR